MKIIQVKGRGRHGLKLDTIMMGPDRGRSLTGGIAGGARRRGGIGRRRASLSTSAHHLEGLL
jgi:hypothetical protein